MNKKNRYITIGVLLASCLIALFLHLYKMPYPCLNSDEAAFGYNAYSIMKTGKDEYGAFLPMRLKSFGEYKLPVMAYLSIPFIGMMGLNETSTRMVVLLAGVLSPILFYFLVKELFQKERIALIAAVLSSMTPWIQMTSRHAHEAVLAYFFGGIMTIFFLKYIKTKTVKPAIIFSIFFLLSLLTHHIAKIFIPLFGGWFALDWWQHRKKSTMKASLLFASIFAIPVLLFGITELIQPTTRINNLLFFKTSGFQLSIEELRREHNVQFLHNKLTHGFNFLTTQYIGYFSPDFLVIKGDDNQKFGQAGISPISIIEYLFLLVGIYYLFKNKEDKRFVLLWILLLSPLTASLSWLDKSLTRSFFMIVPLLIITAYGFYNFVINTKTKWLIAIPIAFYAYFVFFSWDTYFFHYLNKPFTIRAWQCGNTQMGQYVKEHYNDAQSFHITTANGQPYIFVLFYLQYPPEKYQKKATLTPLDQYGFGQVVGFDKFIFNSDYAKEKGAISILAPADTQPSTTEYTKEPQSIKIGDEEIFKIYDNVK